MPPIAQISDRIKPVHAAVLGSLILSWVAICTSPSINRDGMLYAEAARVFLSDGLGAARDVFAWPFLPILMACVSRLTGLGLDASGHLLNALFLAGTCGLIVDCAGRKFPEAAWPICLALLALPGLNHYRDDILREYGCWFFTLLSFWLALRWSEAPSWSGALVAQFALGIAALFRPEALVYFAALAAWQLHTAANGEKLRRALTISGLPLAGLAILALLFVTGELDATGRLASEFSRVNVEKFDAKAHALANALISYASGNAKTILFFGSIAIIPLKFIKHLGIFVVPLAFLLFRPERRTLFARWEPFSWLFLAQALNLVVFVLDMQFLSARYVVVLHLFAVPVIGYGLWLLMQRFPRWKTAMVILALTSMASNVTSLSPKKSPYIDAGAWLAVNAKESPRIYVESSMVTHYAGWRLLRGAPSKDRSELAEAVASHKYDLLVLEKAPGDPDVVPWLDENGLKELRRFGQPGRLEIIMAAPVSAAARFN